MLIVIGFSVALVGGDLAGQSTSEPIMDRLRETITSEGLTLGMLLQAKLDPSIDRSDPDPRSVQVAAMRILLSGSLDGGFNYFLQTNFAAGPSILDARAGWTASDQLGVWAGRFKAPLSRELLTFAGSLDFVNRSRVVEALAPGRQMGVQLRGRVGSGALWSVGGFTGPDNRPANESVVGVARFEVTPQLDGGDARLWIAASAAVGRDGAVGGRVLGSAYEGDGTLFGLDARLEYGRLMLSGEAIVADFDPMGSPGVDAAGLYATAGWMTDERTQVVARWDRYRPLGGVHDDILVLGFNAWPSSASQVRVNWLVPVAGSSSPHKFLVTLQIGF